MAASPRVYRPSVFMHLQIRLEDFSKDQDPDVQSSVDPFAAKLKEVTKKVDSLQRQLSRAKAAPNSVDRAAISTLNRRLKTARAGQKKLQSQADSSRAQAEGEGDEFSIDMYLVPLDCTVDMNSARIADTMQATFPFIDAPLISDVIRAAVVEVWAGTITPEDFAAPDRWRLRRSRSTILFRGWVDAWETTHDETDAKVQISCRSYESILMDAKINPRAPVYAIKNGGEKITSYLDRVLTQFPATSGGSGKGSLRTAWYSADDEPKLDRRALLRTLQTAASRNASAGAGRNDQHVQSDPVDPGGTPPEESEGLTPGAEMRLPPKAANGMSGSEMSIWDLFTQVCELAGCMPTYDPSLPPTDAVPNPGNFILLRPAQTLFEDVSQGYQIKGGAVDGFRRPFILPSGKQIESNVRFLVWGHNIKSFKTTRKLGHVKVLGVEITSLNIDGSGAERTISVRFPKTKFVNKMGAKGEAGTNEYLTVVRQGIRDKKLLEQMAVDLYHAVSRQELGVSIETHDLASYIDPKTSLVHNDEMDMLRVRPGSPCRVAVAREVRTPGQDQTLVISPLSEVFERRDEKLFELLQNQTDRFSVQGTGFFGGTKTEDMQRRISRVLASSKLTNVFYCRSIQHRMTAEDGWSATLELVNFVTARALPRIMSLEDQQADDARKLHKQVQSKSAELEELKATAAARATDALRNRR